MDKVRCAVYTRKSTDEGLDKEFNTLEAQYEAGVSYIKSQKHRGWELVSERYDDGGYSGGNINRPALQRLLEDIKANKIDMIVVYKIDRLTRSLNDFSKLVDVFDAHNCSFVSVTQNFNTYDSMGRLTLNMLLSFAQFEREVDAERIRDKVAASRKKGMWMGGNVPLGYEAVNKKLIVNESEAEIVKLIYQKYRETHSTLQVYDYLKYKNIKCRGKEISMNQLHRILTNVVYIGKVSHKGNIYDGLQEAIISQEIWDITQKYRNEHQVIKLQYVSGLRKSILYGLVECGCCHSRMCITYHKIKSKEYRYYTASKATKNGRKTCEIGSIAVGELDNLVLRQLNKIFKSPLMINEIISQLSQEDDNIGSAEVIKKLKEAGNVFDYISEGVARQVIEKIMSRIVIYKDHLVIKFLPAGVALLDETSRGKLTPCEDDPEIMELSYAVDFRRRDNHVSVSLPEEEPIEANASLLTAVVKAFAWKQQVDNNVSLRQLAIKENLSRQYISKIMKMVYLAPDIIESIITGKQPSHLKLSDFYNNPIPISWVKQRQLYGFEPK